LTVLPPVPPRPPTATPSVPAGAPVSTAPAVTAPVVVGTPCDQENAVGHTARGDQVRCLRDRHHQLRWKIV
jgi:hypothetical protein